MIDVNIVSFNFTEVIVPAREGAIDSAETRKPLHMLPVAGKKGWSVQFDELPKLILKLELSNGIVGVGEFYRDHNWVTIRAVAEDLIGVSLSELALQDLPIPLSREYDGFECAIWDAYAKCLGVPLYALLGGAVQDKVKIGAWSSHRPVSEVGAIAGDFAKQGYDCIKFKCDLEDDIIGWCHEIDKHAPSMKLIFDPNERWETGGESRALLRGLEAVGNVLLIEDPLPKWMHEEYLELRRFTEIPIVQHVSLPYAYQGQRMYYAIAALTRQSVDGFNFNAGLAKFKDLNAIAATANLKCWHGSEVDLGILEAMYLHQAAAASSCVWPSDIFGRMIRSHDLLKVPLNFDPPYAYVPKGMGLGVELDEEVLQKFGISHESIK